MTVGLAPGSKVWRLGRNSGVTDCTVSDAVREGAQFWATQDGALEAYADRLVTERNSLQNRVDGMLKEEQRVRTRIAELRGAK